LARHFEGSRRYLNLPRSRAVDPFSAGARSQIQVISTHSAETFRRRLPALPEDPGVLSYFHEHAVEYSAGQYAAVLKGGSAWGCAHGGVFTCMGEFVPIFSRDPWGPALHEVWRRPYLPAPRRLAGRALYLITPEAAGNYHHWLIDLLPRVGIAEAAGFVASEFDFVILHSATRPYERETLQALGIKPARVVVLGSGDRVQPDELVVPSLKVDNQGVPLNHLHWLRNQFLGTTPVARKGRRLYLSRGDAASRRLLNEAEVFGMLEQKGFEKISLSARSVREQAALFASASIVIGVSGAAFANVAFCAPGTRVVEFASPRWLTVYHWMISARLNLEHTVILGEGSIPDSTPQISGRLANIAIDRRKVQQLLETIC